MGFNFAALPAHIVFQLSCSGIECVADGDIYILMRLILMALTTSYDFFARRSDVDANMVQIALMVMMMPRFHRDLATHNVRMKFLKLAGFFSNSGLNRL